MDKLFAAQRFLHQAHPVLGRLASFLHVRVEPSLAVDFETGVGALTVAADYLAKVSVEALAHALAHASLHAALGHMAPPPGRPEAWSRACDAQVERLLRAFGLSPPTGPVRERHAWWGGSHEEAGEGAPMRQAGASREDAEATAERQAAAQRWRVRAQQAVGEAQGAGDARAALLRELLGEGRDASAQDWRARLAAFLQRWHQAEAHYTRPSRRMNAPFLWPALRPRAARIVLAVDISASIEDELLQRFWAEIQSLAGQMSLALTILAADTRLAPGSPWRFAPGEVPHWPKPHGHGGTDFRPVFDWIGRCGEVFDALIYFTDGKGDYPMALPGLPVLWVMAGTVVPPFGEVIRL